MALKQLQVVGAVLLFFLSTTTTTVSCTSSSSIPTRPPPPRLIIYILADDIGWSDVGFTEGSSGRTSGQNGTSLTPFLDSLATAEGVILNNHITHFMCTPSRTSFFSGRLPVHVNQGNDSPETSHMGLPRYMSTFANKLKNSGNWTTTIAGKYNIGAATKDHFPQNRGFDHSLVFQEAMVDTWTSEVYPGGTACQLLNPNLVDLWSDDGPAVGINNTGFLEDLFLDKILKSLQNATLLSPPPPSLSSSSPQNTFLMWTPKAVHYPLMLPKEWYDAYAWVDASTDETYCNATIPYIYPQDSNNNNLSNSSSDGASSPLPLSPPYSCRRQAWGLMGHLDAAVEKLVTTIKNGGGNGSSDNNDNLALWNSTLIFFSSDNTAPLDLAESGSSNFPLRGSKYSNWQGGIRSPSFVSGGYLPQSVRGTVQNGLIHIADMYATILSIAGGIDPTDEKAKQHGLPPIDSLDMSDLLFGLNSTSPRTEVPISSGAMISYPYKLVRGLNWWSGYSGPIYPNASSTDPNASPDIWTDCGTQGCLFDLSKDPSESNDLSTLYPEIAANISARLDAIIPTFFTNNDSFVNLCPENVTVLCACWMWENVYGGYLGPYQA